MILKHTTLDVFNHYARKVNIEKNLGSGDDALGTNDNSLYSKSNSEPAQ